MSAALEVCDYHGPYPGNFIPSLLAVGAAVRDRLGLDYHCAFPAVMADRPWVQTVQAAGVPIHWLDAERSRRDRLRALTEIAETAGATLMRSHFTTWDLETGVVGRRRGARVVWNIHTGLGGRGARQRLADLVKVRGLGRLCDRVLAVSEAVAQESRSRGFPAAKVALVPNGIDLSRFPDPPARSTAAGRDRVVLAFGWQPHWKGIDVLVEALTPPLEGVTAVLVGRDELRAALPDPLPEGLRVAEPVQDPRELFAAADVFVSASRREAFSYSIGEAMAMRLPVVSSDIPGPSVYFAAPGVVTYPVEDAGALRAAIRTALDSGEGAANRAFVEREVALERHVDGVLALFDDLL